MQRKSFFKSLLGLIVAPKIISEIDWGNNLYHSEIGRGFSFGSKQIFNRDDNGTSNHRTIYTYKFDYSKNIGEYTAHLLDGRKITFPIHEYNPDQWHKEYGYLSELN